MSVVQHGYDAATAGFVTLTNPVGSGNAIEAFAFGPLPATVTLTDDKGNTYPPLDSVSDTPNGVFGRSYRLGNITNGPKTFTPSAAVLLHIVESTAAALSDPVDGHAGQLQTSVGTGAGAITSGSFSPTTAATVVGATFNTLTGALASVFTGFTLLDSDNTNITYDEFLILGSPGSTAVQFTAGTAGGTWITLGMGIKPAIVAAPVTLGQTPRRIFVPGKGPDKGLRSPKAFPASSAVLTLPAGQGTYSLTGFAAPLSIVPNPVGRTTPRIFRPDSGPHLNLNRPKAFPTTGGPVTFTLAAGQGTYTLNGVSQTLLRGIQLAAGQGTYTLTGKPQTLNRTIQINAGQGTYTLTGKPQTFAFTMPAAQGTYSLTGQAQTLAVGMPAGQGTYALTGKPQSFAVALSLLAGQGTYSLNGIGQVLTFTPAGGGATLPHSNPFFATPGSLTSLP